MAAQLNLEELINNPRTRRLRISVICFCFLVMFFDGYDNNILGFVAANLAHYFHIQRAALGPVMSAGLFGFMVGALGLGEMGDRIGRKQMIIIGTSIFGLLTLLAVTTQSELAFIVLRFLAGIGLGGAIPNAIALNTEYASRRLKATAIGVMFVGYTLGGASPGLVASSLLSKYGWQGVFTVGGVLPIVLSILMALALPESIRYLVTTRRYAKLNTLMQRVGSSLPAGQDWGMAQDAPTHQKAPTRQLFVREHLLTTIFLWVACITCLMNVVFMISWGSTIVIDLGFNPSKAALVGAMYGIGGAFGSVVVTRLMDKFGPGAVSLSAVLTVPFVVMIGYDGHSQPLLMATFLIAGFFGNGAQVGLSALAGTIYPTLIRATGAGWAFGVGRVGAILGPLIGSALIANSATPQTLLMAMAVPAIVAAVAVGVLARHRTPPRAAVQVVEQS
ncbi:sugar phosphate permease [Burkholderia sp. Ch1-1]|nr:sugar phosphate permease [Burkholderia sp. Ch1-1]